MRYSQRDEKIKATLRNDSASMFHAQGGNKQTGRGWDAHPRDKRSPQIKFAHFMGYNDAKLND